MAVRVLWVVKGLGPGGAEHLLAAAARVHDSEHFDIECAYVLPYKDHLVGDLEAAGVATHCLSRGNRDLRWPLRLARLVRKGGFDVVHVHSPLPASVARLAARGMGERSPRFVSTEHNGWASHTLPTRLANRVTSRWNDATFAVSEEARASMSGPAAKQAVTLVHGIDIARTAAFASARDEVRRTFGLPLDAFVIGTVANFREQKDYPNLLQAARLTHDAGLPVRWLLVGQGPQEQQTRALATEMGLDSVVTFTGFQPDAARVMAAFDVFTLASKWEGLPVALMEALALGLPVVATAVGGVAEAMHDGTDAVLVPAGDAAALAAGWHTVFSDDELRRRLGAAGRARSGEFDAARAQRAIESAYLGGALPPAAEPEVHVSRRRPTAVEIRPAGVGDREAILQLLQRSMGRSDDPRFADLYRWKHDLNAFGPSPTWVAVEGGQVVAVRVFMRWEFVRGGQVLRAVRAVDTATDPDHQGKGLFSALTLHGLEEMRAEGVDFVFNTPNSQSRPGYLKMGWREVGALPVAVRPVGPMSLVRMARSRAAAEHWSQPLAIGTGFEEWVDGRSGWRGEAHLPIRTLATHTTEAFDRWRFGWPELHYRVVEADGGAVVLRARRRGEATELVQVASFGLSAAQADRVAARAAREAGATYVLRLGQPRPRAGYVPLPGGGPMLTWRDLNTAGLPPLSNWQLTMGDVELF